MSDEPKRRGRPPKAETVTVPEGEQSEAQAYARKVWAGQSDSLSSHERMGRIRAALEAQGLSMEGVELP